MLRIHTKASIRLGAAVCLLLLASAGSLLAADRYLIGPATLHASADVPQTMVDGLNPQGWELFTQSFGIKETICEVFLAKTVAAAGAPNEMGKTPYSSLERGALIGVIHLLPEATEDYTVESHNQELKPGFYTLRYAVLPAGTYENGTKLGDFVVLSPIRLDHDPRRVLKAEDLTHLGSSTSGTDVAATMALVEADAKAPHFPSVKVDENRTCIFQVRLPLASTKKSSSKAMPLAIAMFTPNREAEGS